MTSAAVDIREFISLLKHSRGDWAGRPFVLEGWQSAYLDKLFNTKRADGLRQYRTSLLALPRKNGKALALDTPILTIQGPQEAGVFRAMGDIAVGDTVCHPGGKLLKVTAATDPMVARPCYEVRFYWPWNGMDDEVIVADEGHLWQVTVSERSTVACRSNPEPMRIVTTAEIAAMIEAGLFVCAACGGRRAAVRSCNRTPSVPVRCIEVDSADGMFLVGMSLIPTHNSALSAAVGLYMLCCDDFGGEVIVAAGDRSQAALLHTAAKQFVESCPSLARRCKIYRNSIVMPERNSTMLCISSEAGTKHGYNPSCVLIDEMHVFPDRELIDVLETGMGARSQPLTIYITTAGTDRLGPCFKDWERAEKIRDGIIKDDTFLPCIYAAPQDADPFSEETWRIANPNYGVTLKQDYFRQFAERARQSPSDEVVFRTLHLNQWVASSTKFFRHGSWDSCNQPLRPPAGRPCYCGLDLASTYDTTAFVAVWPDADGSFDVQAMFWIPEDNAEARKKDRVPYETWARDGFVRMTEGDVTDYDVVRDYILDFCGKNWVKGIAVDRWNAIHLMTQLTAEGQTVHPFGQGYGPMNAPTRLLENLVMSSRLRHDGNPVLAWQASNVQGKTNDEGLVKLVKKSSHDPGRIDGIIALVMALSIASGEAYSQPAEQDILVL